MAVNVKGTVVTPKAPVSVSGQNLGAVNKPAAGASAIGTPVRTGTVSSPAPSYSYNSGMNQGAANQIVYLKQLYDQAAAAGKPKSSLTSIANKAQEQYGQLDPTTATQLKGMNAQQAAAWYQGFKDEQNQQMIAPAAGASGIRPTQNTQNTQVAQQPQDPYADMMNNPLYQMMMQQMQGYEQQMAAYGQQQQEQQAYMQQMQSQNYQNLIGQYQTAQGNDLAALDRQFEQSKSELADSSFQDYLRAQQQMANRGLAGSGLANDQDTRLLMANNKNLNNLQNSVLNQKASIQQQYQGQIGGIQQQLAAINFPSVAGGSLTSRDTGTTSAGRMMAPNTTNLDYTMKMLELFQPYLDATVKDQMDYSRLSQKDQMDFMKDMMPYQQATVAEQMTAQNNYMKNMMENQLGYDKLGSEEKRFYDKLDVDSQFKVMELGQKHDLKMTELMGYDKNGNPTFAASKFVQEFDLNKWYKEQSVQQGWSNISIKQFTAEQNAAQGWEKVAVSQQNANTRIAELQVKAGEIEDKKQRNSFLDQMNAANKQKDSAFKSMAAEQKIMDNINKAANGKALTAAQQADFNAAFERYQKASKQYELNYDAIDTLAQLNVNEGLERNPAGKIDPKSAQNAQVDGYNTQGILNRITGGSSPGKATGSLSSAYEGSVGTIARTKGDIGGASYGKYQFTQNSGSAKGFVQSLKNTDPAAYKKLAAHPVGTSGFDAAWKQVAASNKNFGSYQEAYARKQYYETAAKSVLKNNGLDVNKRSKAVQEAIWSTSVQHGSGSVTRIVKAAGITPSMSDTEILKRLYAERGANNGAKYFKSSPKNIQVSVANRFKKELQDALKMV